MMNKLIIKRAFITLLALSSLNGYPGMKQLAPNRPAARQTEQAASPLEQAEEKLLDECHELLEVCEQLHSGMSQALEDTDAFVQTSSWESLLKARASASAALAAIRQMELPSFDLTAEEVKLLSSEGIEANSVQREFEALEDLCTGRADSATLLYYALEDDVFLKAGLEHELPDMVRYYRAYYTLEYRYQCAMVNYILLQMDGEAHWQLWTEQLPGMAQCADPWYDGEDAVQGAASQTLDEIQTLQPQLGSILGSSEFMEEVIREASQTGSLDALRREVVQIAGVPGYFPRPDWFPDALGLYLVTDGETGQKRLVKAGEELSSVPSACYLPCGEVAVEDVQAYEELLKQWGIMTYGVWNEAKDHYQVLVKSGDSTMMIDWTREDTTLYLTEPIGCLIPEIYLVAMLAE